MAGGEEDIAVHLLQVRININANCSVEWILTFPPYLLCLFYLFTASIAAEGQALCQIAKALSNVVMTNVWNGQNYVTTYPFGPYVHYLPWWEDSGVEHGYNPSNSTCYYDTTVPLHQPEWCQGNWGSSAIGCDQYYSITSLSVNGNSWTKATTIPTAIGVLMNLQSLQITSVGLTGPIPTSVGRLSRLTWLNLQNNMLTGTVPSFVTNVLSWSTPSLQYNCNLTSSIPAIRNQMSNFASSPGKCSNDRKTIAAEGQAICQLALAFSNVRVNMYSFATYTDVPKPVFWNSHYGDISLNYGYNPANSTCYYNTSMPVHQPVWCNSWSGISCSNNKVTSLSIQGSSWTNTVKIPTVLGALTNLNVLSLNSMGFTGSIPNLMSLSRLTYISLTSNMLTGVVPKFINRTDNNNIYLSSNCNLTSPIPRITARLSDQDGQYCPAVTAIAAEGKAMCMIAQVWSNMQMYQWTGYNNTMTNVFGSFSYSNTGGRRYWRTGYVPGKTTCYYYTNTTHTSSSSYQPVWCTWPSVSCSNNRVISLSINSPTWTTTSRIPTALNALGKLQSLTLNSMGLTGRIPDLSLSHLTYISLTSNMLTGVVPNFINLTANINNIYLDSNCNLTSPIPRITARLTDQGGQDGQYCPAVTAIAAEGKAMCMIAQVWSNMQMYQWTGYNNTMTNVFGSFSYSNTGGRRYWRTGYVPGKTTCYYYTNTTHTSSSSYQPVWCTWPSVSCSNNRVISLSINSPTWTTTSRIPTALNALDNLQSLYVTYAGLSGSIPNLVGLSKLSSLQLYGNRLTGDVPTFINTMTTRPNTQVNIQTNCNLTWTSTSPMATNSYAYYNSQGNCAPPVPLTPGKLLLSLLDLLFVYLLYYHLLMSFLPLAYLSIADGFVVSQRILQLKDLHCAV